MRILSLLMILLVPVVGQTVEVDKKKAIVKWCDDDSGHQRFASEGITPVGYMPCGEVRTIALCDPLGNKYIGSPESAPYGYKDCRLGQRIFLKVNGEVIDVPALYKEEIGRLAKLQRDRQKQRAEQRKQDKLGAQQQDKQPAHDFFRPENIPGLPEGLGLNNESLETIMKLLHFSKDTFEFMADQLNNS